MLYVLFLVLLIPWMWAGVAAGVQSSEEVGYTQLSTSDSLWLRISNERLKFSRPRHLNLGTRYL